MRRTLPPSTIADRHRSRFDVAFLIVAGSLWHFVYAWSGDLAIVGAIAPINESVWEHLKLGYGATILLIPIDIVRARHGTAYAPLGRAVGVIIIDVLIVVVFYAYTAVSGRSILAVDIGLYVLGCWIAVVAHNAVAARHWPSWSAYVGWSILLCLGVLFALWTFSPPELGPFIP